MEPSVGSWLLAAAPIVWLLAGILVLKWPTYKVAAVGAMVAAALALTYFGADLRLLLFASSKGLSLALFVLLIIWAAVFLYNLADQAGAIAVIGKAISKASQDEVTQALLLAWCFTALLQGLAGYGVPVVVVAPIMIAMGFQPMVAVVACLVGHSWSISFGSMGSSYLTIQLVTGIPGDIIGPQMALLCILPIFLTGFSVAHIQGGFSSLRKSIPLVLISGTMMSAGLYGMNLLGMAQLAGLGAALCGCISTVVYAKVVERGRLQAPEPAAEANLRMGLLVAGLPYFALIGISVVLYLPPIKSALSRFYLGFNYPSLTTRAGYVVEAVEGYSKILLFSHPAPILLVSAFLGYLVYVRLSGVAPGILRAAARQTVKTTVPTTIGITTMVIMALIMSDSGMTRLLAIGFALVFSGFYPIISPFIGVLGTFLTGSNTVSNITFGKLQYEIAAAVGNSPVTMAGLQSVGGSLGVSVSPSAIMMGATSTGLGGQEGGIMSRTLRYCLPVVFALGVMVWAITLVGGG